MLRAELLKLRRSHLWLIAIVLPLLAVITGSINYFSNPGALTHGWDSLFSQVLLFYGMFYLSIGVAVIVAAAWRMEHQGSNYTMLRTNTRRAVSLIAAKTTAVSILILFMQLILVVGTFVVGVTFASHNGAPPLKYLVLVLISIVAAVPLVLLQSVLSMYLKSFAAPIAWSFLGLIIGIAFSFAPGWIRDLGWLFPYSLVSRSLSLISVATGATGTSIDILLLERLNAWVGHPLRLFIIVALGVLFTISFLDPHPTVGVPALTSTQHIIGFVVYLTVTMALCIHPKYPDATMGVIACSFTALLVAQVASDFPRVGIPLLYVIYLASANCNPRWRPLWLVWILAGIAAAEMMNDKLLDADAQNYVSAWQLRVTAVVISWIIVGFFWQLGGVARRRQAEHQALQDRAELAAIVERTRIAREMHDIVAHNLSAVIALADGARYTNPTNPEVGTEALETIAATSRSALKQMRGLLSVLRDNEGRDADAVFNIAAIRGLLYDARHAGLDVHTSGIDTLPDDLPQLIQTTLYRIIQELLTNMLKYSPGQRGQLTVETTEKHVTITATNRLPEHRPDPGYGIQGMRERATALGGATQVRTDNNEFLVKVEIPR